MADVAIPAPGGAVGFKRFAVYALGGVAGLTLYSLLVDPAKMPAWYTRTIWGPLSVDDFFVAGAVLVGAGLAGKML